MIAADKRDCLPGAILTRSSMVLFSSMGASRARALSAVDLSSGSAAPAALAAGLGAGVGGVAARGGAISRNAGSFATSMAGADRLR